MVTSAIGVFSIISSSYTAWYNWKYKDYNIKALPDDLGSFRYVAKPGYHLEATCKRAGENVRIPKVESFDHLSMDVDNKTVNTTNCKIIVVEDVDVVPPLSDYNITKPKTE